MGILDLNPDDYIIKPPTFKPAAPAKEVKASKPIQARINPNAGGYDSSYSASFLLRNFLPDFDLKTADLDFFADLLEPDLDAPARDLSTRPSLHWPGVAAVRDREERERNAAKRERRHSRQSSDALYSPAVPSPGHVDAQRGHVQAHSAEIYPAEPIQADFDVRYQEQRPQPPRFQQHSGDQPGYSGYRPDVEHDRGYANGTKRKYDGDMDLETLRRRRADIVARCRQEDDILLRDPHNEEALARRAHFLEQLRVEDEMASTRARRPAPVIPPPNPALHSDPRSRPPPAHRPPPPHAYPGHSQLPVAPPAHFANASAGFARPPSTNSRAPAHAVQPLSFDPRDPRARNLSDGHERSPSTTRPVNAASLLGESSNGVPRKQQFRKVRFFFYRSTPAEADKIKREGACIVEHSEAQGILAEAFQGGKVFLVLRGPEPGQLLGYAQMEGNLWQGLKPSWMTEAQEKQGASFFPINYQRPNLFWSEDARLMMQSVVQDGPDTHGVDEMSFEEGSRCLNLVKAARPGSNNIARGEASEKGEASATIPLPAQTAVSDDSQLMEVVPLESIQVAATNVGAPDPTSTPEVPEPAVEVISSN
ncbi:hypothetical protein BCR37DRAFT_153842 [Protomyces lactucae-debilis]|uniref:YTH domain-containing protein n=1 Tax=Protomyces lactucae-debilis TaxID=2754530 RepID=A0A1Y2F0G5_PROLT|nr:uncharacterized protein BCR37DRAFT_153842 [Protomyces lactucae-debilis]ORY77372.1 hypothetical protein BCR37DRAFT_153842 [Protomyces lactucae-debilis]